jgi:peptidoglycan/LPS O-acetylase OafA/YrhL
MFHFTKSNIEFIGSSAYFKNVASYGWLGVEIFFVVSGFIITYSLLANQYQISQFFKFIAKRTLRIEPPYILSIILVILLGYISSKIPGYKGEVFSFDFIRTLSHIAYLPEHFGYDWILPVYWSLEAEFHFYILVGLVLPFMFNSKFHFIVFSGLMLLSGFLFPLRVFDYMPLFMMGISVCAYKVERISQYLFYALLGIAAFSSILKGHDLSMPVVGLITALTITHINWNTKISDFFGKISFSLYLIHVPIGGRIINLGGRYANTELKVWLVLFLAIGITILVSWIFYLLIELPSQKFSKRIKFSH